MNTHVNFRRTALRLAIAVLAALPALLLLFGQPGQAVQAKEDPSALRQPVGDTNKQAATAHYTLICFVRDHLDPATGKITSSDIGIYTLDWSVSDKSQVEFQMASGQLLPCPGSVTLTVTGAMAGADGFNTFTCAITQQQGCTINIPVAGGGSVSGLPGGEPTLSVPAGQTGVLNITTAVQNFAAP